MTSESTWTWSPTTSKDRAGRGLIGAVVLDHHQPGPQLPARLGGVAALLGDDEIRHPPLELEPADDLVQAHDLRVAAREQVRVAADVPVVTQPGDAEQRQKREQTELEQGVDHGIVYRPPGPRARSDPAVGIWGAQEISLIIGPPTGGFFENPGFSKCFRRRTLRPMADESDASRMRSTCEEILLLIELQKLPPAASEQPGECEGRGGEGGSWAGSPTSEGAPVGAPRRWR